MKKNIRKPILVTPLSAMRNVINSADIKTIVNEKPIIYCNKSNLETNTLKDENEENITEEIGGKHSSQAPLPGRIIQKSNLVITPDGIALKEEIIKRQKPQIPPKVPPKPNKEFLNKHVSIKKIFYIKYLV